MRLLPGGRIGVKAYGRPVAGGRAGSVPFPGPDDPRLAALGADRAGLLWAEHAPLA